MVIDSLSGRHMMLQLRKRKGFEAEDVLDQSDKDSEGAPSATVSQRTRKYRKSRYHLEVLGMACGW